LKVFIQCRRIKKAKHERQRKKKEELRTIKTGWEERTERYRERERANMSNKTNPGCYLSDFFACSSE